MRSLEVLLRRWRGLAKTMKHFGTHKVSLSIDVDIITDTIEYLKTIEQPVGDK